MNLGKPNAHRRQNSGTFWSIARDRQFDLESENVHRSSEHPSPGRMIVLYVVSEEKKKHLIKRITGWLQTEYQAKNMFRRFRLREDVIMTLPICEIHCHTVCFPITVTAKKQVRFKMKLRIHVVPIDDRTSNWMLMTAD